MNKLSLSKQVEIITRLIDGTGLRKTAKSSRCSINTVTKLLEDVGYACLQFHNDCVRDLKCKRIQCDEMWSFVYAKEKNVNHDKPQKAGDAWIWIAIDPDSKLVVSWYVGNRDTDSACIFMKDVADRLAHRVQLTTDGFKGYEDAVEYAFEGNVDFAQVVKQYGEGKKKNGKVDKRQQYIGSEKRIVIGKPDPSRITTSHVERQNLTVREGMSRFRRKTLKFSKKWENHCHGLAIFYVYYNFVNFHKTIRVTPAMEAGLANKWMEMEDLVRLVHKYPPPNRRLAIAS